MKPSGLLTDALEDLRLCEQQGIKIDFSCWVERVGDELRCCLGGARMIQKYGIRTDCGPNLMPVEVRPELWFLHYIALGEIDYALDELGIQWSGPVKHAVIPYRVDRMTWLESVQNIVQILSEAGV